MFVTPYSSIPPLISNYDVYTFYTSLHSGWTFLSMECSFLLATKVISNQVGT
jgi:hypothetical protein